MKRLRWDRVAQAGVALALAMAVTACQSAAAPSVGQPQPAAAPTKLFLMVDMVQGSKNVPQAQAASQSCVLTSRFPRNSEMVWRARVFDPKTGDLMDDKALSKVEVKLANGTSLEMRYGPHPPQGQNREFYWTTSWVVPKDHATGTLKYSVLATGADGRVGDFEPFSVAPSLPAITDEVLADAPAKG